MKKKVEYLYKPRKQDEKRHNYEMVIHIWNYLDTVCQMSKVGGYDLRHYKITTDTLNRKICNYCLTNRPIHSSCSIPEDEPASEILK